MVRLSKTSFLFLSFSASIKHAPSFHDEMPPLRQNVWLSTPATCPNSRVQSGDKFGFCAPTFIAFSHDWGQIFGEMVAQNKTLGTGVALRQKCQDVWTLRHLPCQERTNVQMNVLGVVLMVILLRRTGDIKFNYHRLMCFLIKTRILMMRWFVRSTTHILSLQFLQIHNLLCGHLYDLFAPGWGGSELLLRSATKHNVTSEVLQTIKMTKRQFLNEPSKVT